MKKLSNKKKKKFKKSVKEILKNWIRILKRYLVMTRNFRDNDLDFNNQIIL